MCEICQIAKAYTILTAFGANRTERIPICAECRAKAKASDPETWETIREILRGQ